MRAIFFFFWNSSSTKYKMFIKFKWQYQHSYHYKQNKTFIIIFSLIKLCVQSSWVYVNFVISSQNATEIWQKYLIFLRSVKLFFCEIVQDFEYFCHIFTYRCVLFCSLNCFNLVWRRRGVWFLFVYFES